MPLLGIRSLRTIIIPGIMQEFQNEDRIIAYKSGWLVSLYSIHLSPCAFTWLHHISHTNHIKEALSAVMLKIFCLWFWKYKRWISVWIAKLFKKSGLNGLTREKTLKFSAVLGSKTWGMTSEATIIQPSFYNVARFPPPVFMREKALSF